MKPKSTFWALIGTLLMVSSGCTYHQLEIEDESGYPKEVASIMTSKCATAGCHNSISYGNAAGINLSTWESAFDFGRAGTSIIPFSTDYSYLLYFVNTDSTRAPALQPTMPLDGTPLSNEEYQTLYDWILRGAPDKAGRLRYPDDVDRRKVYVCMQGCDQVAVIDADSKNIMRYVPVGNDPLLIESPHQVRISPDGQYWYAVFFSGQVVQKFRTSDDRLVGTVNIGTGDWNTIMITPDGHKGFVNGTSSGLTVVVNLDNMTVETQLAIDFPHGGFITPDGHWLYLTAQQGNFITKVDLTDPGYSTEYVLLQPGEARSTISRYDAHEMVLSTDATKYFVSCQKSNEVRAFRLLDDSLLAILPSGQKPQEFAASGNRPYIYVTCVEDPIDARRKGSVFIYNSQSLTFIDSIYTGFEPHGIAADDDDQLIYVANLNLDNAGPAPHHVSACGGRNGYMTCIDERTLELFQKTLPNGDPFTYKQEVLRAPYFVSYKH